MPAFPKLVLILLRDGRDPERLRRAFENWRELFVEVLRTGDDAMMQVLCYVAEVTSEVQFEDFRATILRHHPMLEDSAVTYAEQLRQQGRQQGREQGLQQGFQQGRAELLTKLVRLRFGELSPRHEACLQTASAEELDRYCERVLSAETLEELFAGAT